MTKVEVLRARIFPQLGCIEKGEFSDGNRMLARESSFTSSTLSSESVYNPLVIGRKCFHVNAKFTLLKWENEINHAYNKIKQ